MKKFRVYNTASAIQEAVRDLTRQMSASGYFYNISVKPHKDPSYVWVCVG